MPKHEVERLARFVDNYTTNLEKHRDALLAVAATLELEGKPGAEDAFHDAERLEEKAGRVRDLVPPSFL